MLTKICDLYAKFLRALLLVLGCTLLFAVTLQVAGRFVGFVPRYLWTLELSRFSLIWMIFVGSAVGLRERRHFFIDVFRSEPRGAPALFLNLLYYATLLSVTYVFVRYGYEYFDKWGGAQVSEITDISLRYLYASVPVAGWSWLLFLIEAMWKDIISNLRGDGPV